MCRTYGYARISTPKQSIERQIRNIKQTCNDAIIVQEVYTGTKTEGREAWARLYRQIKRGDTIIFDSVSKMSRDALEGFTMYKALFDMGVNLVFLKEPQINTETYKQATEKQINGVNTGDNDTDELMDGITAAINRYMMRLAQKQIKIAFDQAEKEVEDLRQRTREGIETARLNDKQIGGKLGRKLNVKKAASAKEIIRKHSRDFDGTLNDAECMKLAGIARNTYYKYKKELMQEG